MKTGFAITLLALLVAGADVAQAFDAMPFVRRDKVARVNGVEITREEIETVERQIYESIAHLSKLERDEIVLRRTINTVLASEAALAQGLAADPEVQRRIAFLQREILQQVHLARYLVVRVNQETVQAYYTREIAGVPRAVEVRARHILLRSRADAERILASLARGEEFKALARAYSLDKATAGGGGDLGYLKRAALVAPFADAAFALKEGETSAPVETPYGWHIIKIEDRRAREVPQLADVRQQIIQILTSQARQEFYEELRRNAEIVLESGERN